MTKEQLGRLMALAEARGYWSHAPAQQPAAEAEDCELLWAAFSQWMPDGPVSRAKRGKAK